MWKVLAAVAVAAVVVWVVASERRFKRFKARFGEVVGTDTFPSATAQATIPIIISMTSSPSRLLSSLPRVLRGLESATNDIRIVLPRKFRNTELYDETAVADLQAAVFRIEDDLGPLTKALPVLESVAHEDQECVVVTVDDDAMYNPEDLIVLANTAHTTGKIATGFAKWDVVLHIWIPFGNHAIAYPKSVITEAFVNQIREVAQQGGSECRVHDDMVLAVAAARHGLGNPLVQDVRRKLLEDSFSDDALMYAFPNKDEACAQRLA